MYVNVVMEPVKYKKPSETTFKMAGYLYKKRKMRLVGGWRRYWFVLQDGLLLYFGSRKEWQKLGTCRGSVTLAHGTQVRPAGDTNLEIINRTSTVTLRAADAGTCVQWVRALIGCLSVSTSTTTQALIQSTPLCARGQIQARHFRYSVGNLLSEPQSRAVEALVVASRCESYETLSSRAPKLPVNTNTARLLERGGIEFMEENTLYDQISTRFSQGSVQATEKFMLHSRDEKLSNLENQNQIGLINKMFSLNKSSENGGIDSSTRTGMERNLKMCDVNQNNDLKLQNIKDGSTESECCDVYSVVDLNAKHAKREATKQSKTERDSNTRHSFDQMRLYENVHEDSNSAESDSTTYAFADDEGQQDDDQERMYDDVDEYYDKINPSPKDGSVRSAPEIEEQLYCCYDELNNVCNQPTLPPRPDEKRSSSNSPSRKNSLISKFLTFKTTTSPKTSIKRTSTFMKWFNRHSETAKTHDAVGIEPDYDVIGGNNERKMTNENKSTDAGSPISGGKKILSSSTLTELKEKLKSAPNSQDESNLYSEPVDKKSSTYQNETSIYADVTPLV